MADFNAFFPVLLAEEGGFVDNKNDHGGATNLGITLYEWEKSGWDKDGDHDIDLADLKIITKQDAMKVYKILYWDYIKGDEISSQSVAEIIFDWGVNSGVNKATKSVQSLIGIKADGVFGPQTLKAINQAQPQQLFGLIKASREAYYRRMVYNNPSQGVFLKGWLNRINAFIFKG